MSEITKGNWLIYYMLGVTVEWMAIFSIEKGPSQS